MEFSMFRLRYVWYYLTSGGELHIRDCRPMLCIEAAKGVILAAGDCSRNRQMCIEANGVQSLAF